MLHHTGEPPDSRTRALTPAFSLLRRTLPRPGPAGARRLMTSPGKHTEAESTPLSPRPTQRARFAQHAEVRPSLVAVGPHSPTGLDAQEHRDLLLECAGHPT